MSEENSELSELEIKSVNYETMRHIESVRNILDLVVIELLNRGKEHDQEKMRSPEVELFTEYTKKLKTSTYGSPEYNQFLKEMKPALEHHYSNYRHHPEHFPNGINDMNLIDLIEMFCDWKASSKRHNDGNILKSIDINRTRFNIPDTLVNIFRNTASFLEQKEK